MHHVFNLKNNRLNNRDFNIDQNNGDDISFPIYSVGACSLTFDAEAAGVQDGALGVGDVDLQTELLQRPAVGLGHVLARGRDVSLGHKQAAETHVDVLDGGEVEILKLFKAGSFQTVRRTFARGRQSSSEGGRDV